MMITLSYDHENERDFPGVFNNLIALSVWLDVPLCERIHFL